MNRLNNYINSVKHFKRFAFAILALVMFSLSTNAQLVNVPVTGFNNDVVANGGGAVNTPNTGVTNATIGYDGGGYCLVSQGYLAGSATPTCFMPASLNVPSLLTAGLNYTLQGYGTSSVNNNNALTITQPSSGYTSPYPSTNTLTLTTPASYSKLYFLVGSIMYNSPNTMSVTVNFTDATSQTFTGASFPNWFNGSVSTTAFYQFNRVHPNNTGFTNVCGVGTYTTQPSMFEYSVNLSSTNYGKLVSSITFTHTSAVATGTTANTVDYIHIMAVGGLPPCVIPSAQPTAAALNTNSTSQISGSFTAATGSPTGYLVVRYPSPASEVLPSNGTIYTVGQSLGLGTVVQTSNTTSFTNTGLTGGTAYDFYVYAYNNTTCGGGPLYLTTGSFIGTQSTNACGTLNGTIEIGPSAPAAPSGFPSLTAALNYISTFGIGGSTILELQTDYSVGVETLPLTFAPNACINSSKTLTIRPETGVVSPIVYTSTNTTATFLFDGGSYITIDGRPGGSGIDKMIRIKNTSSAAGAAGKAILLQNESVNNIFTYLDLQASNLNPATNVTIFANTGLLPGVIAIGTTTGTTGNDNNTISFCDIHAATSVGDILNVGIFAYSSLPITSAAVNDNNTIHGNNIFDCFSAIDATAGINISGGNNNYTITNNSYYKSDAISYSYTAAGKTHRGFYIVPGNSPTAASGYTISNNFIGGTAPNCGGNPYTMPANITTVWIGMDITVGTQSASNVFNNTIQNINLTTSNALNPYFAAFNIASGNINVGLGAGTGNIIGAETGNGSITINNTINNAGTFAYGIRIASPSIFNANYNKIGSITINNGAGSNCFNAIATVGSGITSGTINNNLIGSLTTSNSIQTTGAGATATAMGMCGIYISSGPATSTINNNIIRNLYSSYTGTSSTTAFGLRGIDVAVGSNTVTGNEISNLTSNSASIGSMNSSAICGLAMRSTTAPSNVSRNTIHTLKLTNPITSTVLQITGLFFEGPTSGANIVSGNKLHSLYLTAINNSAVITGITVSGVTANTATYSNNMVRLGYDELGNSITAGMQIRGISKGATNGNSFYHNSVYIGGANVVSSTANSFAFQKGGSGSDIAINNIFVNNRSNASTGGKHYAISVNTITGLTLNSNVYYGTGTGYVFGAIATLDYPALVNNWVPGDANSYAFDPIFMNPNGNAVTGDLHINPAIASIAEGAGIPVPGITNDYDNDLRSAFSPIDIGADAGNFTSLLCNGTPAGGSSFVTPAGALCLSGTKTLIITGVTNVPGITFQWKQSAVAGGPYTNVVGGTGATTQSFTTPTITSNTYYVCEVSCTNGGGSSLSTESLVSVSIPAVDATVPALRCGPGSVTLGATASAGGTLNWYDVATGGFSLSTSSTFNTPVISTTTTYWVSTSIGTCISPRTAVVATITSPPAFSITPSQSTCFNSIVQIQVTSPVANYTSYLWSPVTNLYTDAAATLPYTGGIASTLYYKSGVAGTTTYTCNATDGTCNNVSTTSVTNVPDLSASTFTTTQQFDCSTQNLITVTPNSTAPLLPWYFNDFSSSILNPVEAQLAGAPLPVISGGKLLLSGGTTITTGTRGGIQVFNPNGYNAKAFQIDFDLNIVGGPGNADGISYSFGDDVLPVPNNNPTFAENGSGTKLKLGFDSAPNGTNLAGIYLMYNCNIPLQAPSTPGVLGFVANTTWFANSGSVTKHVSITISNSGTVSVLLDAVPIFTNVQLPPSYLTANKSTWTHVFAARTGSIFEQHNIDNFNVKYIDPNFFEYSINNGASWQTDNVFSVAPGIYPVSVRLNGSSSCVANLGNAVITTPVYNTNATANNICVFNQLATTLSISPTFSGAVYQWESSPAGANAWSAISGANNPTYTPSSVMANTDFRCQILCNNVPVSGSPSNPVTITVKEPILLTTAPATRCGAGSVTLNATASAGSLVKWYAAATGGLPLITGNSFTTPIISGTTNYWVAANATGTPAIVGPAPTVTNCGTLTTSTVVDLPIRFNTTKSIILNSVDIIPGSAGTLTVALRNTLSAVNIQTATFTFTAAQVGVLQTLPLGFLISSAGSYQLTNLGVGGSRFPTFTCSYPFNSPNNEFSIVGAAATSTSATSTGFYTQFFNFNVSETFCESVRTLVTATVDPSTPITAATLMTTVCAGNSTEVSVSSANDPNYTYDWTSTPAGFTATGPGPHTVTPTGAGITYQVYAYDASTQCGALSNVLVNTTTNNITATVLATPANVCYGGDVQLNSVAFAATDVNDYSFAASTGTFTPLVGGTATSLIANADLATSNPFNIGFTFNYGGVNYTTVQASAKGVLLFGTGKTHSSTNNLATTTPAQRPGVAALWDDLQCTSGVKYQVTGIPGNQVLTVEWLNMEWSYTATVPAISFQIKLYESTGAVQFIYRQESAAITGSGASIGIMGVSPTDFISLQSPGAAPVLSTTSSMNTILTKPATGQVYTFTPVVSASFSYDWSANPNYLNNTGIINPIAQAVQTSEVYSVTVTDNNTGCVKVANKTVNVLPLPVPSAFSNSPVCENADILLFAFDGATYTWTGPDNFSTTGFASNAAIYGAQQINSGNYTVDVIGANGCTASETIYVQVNDNPEPYIASMSEVSCTGFSDGTFQVGVNGGTPFFSFNEASLGQNFSGFYSGLAAGTYTVDVTDLNQCLSQFPLQVTVTSVPNAAPVISCPSNIVVTSTPGLCGAIVNYATPIGSDVCPIIGTSQIAGLASGWTFPVGTTVNTFSVTDIEGLTTDCSFSVTVTETEAPTIANCPVNFSSCNPVTWTPPTITDNCPGVVITSSHVPGTNFAAGTTTVTYTATDVYNNVSTCSFQVTRYEESTAPTGITSDRDFNNICTGETVNLTINGGSVGQGSMWKWYTGTCGGAPLPAFNGMSTISVNPAVTTTYFARAEGLCNTTACVSITVVVSNAGPASGVLAITSMPPFGAPGITGTIDVTPVPGATFYRWSSINGHINAVWFPTGPGPVDTNVPSVNVLFNQSLSNYQIRVVAGNACGRTNNVSAHIRGTVPASTCLTGPALACPNTTATYSVASCPIPGTNTYQWAVTGNATITAGQGTPTITVSFGAGFTTGTVCVNGITNFGLAGPQTCLSISNNTVAPGAITGNNEPCQASFENYTIAPVAGASSYLWSTNITGATASGTSTSGTVQFPSGPFSGNVCVQAISSCGMSVATCFSVASGIPGVPGPILGPESGICGAVGNYALTTNDANSYNWIVPAGVTLVSPNGSNSVQIQFPSAPGSHVITVEAFYDCGSATSTITVNGAPGTPIVTPATICAGGTDETYIASAAGADSYNWTTSGAIYEQCTNPNCSNYYIIWDTPGGSFSVNAVNACGISAVPFSISTNCRISEGVQMNTKVYPNPNTGQFIVEFTSYAGGTYNMTVTDMSGRMVLTEDVKASSGNNQHMMNLENANPGMYMLYIKDGNGQISVTKITVE